MDTLQWIAIVILAGAVIYLLLKTPKKEQVDTLENKTKYMKENE